MAVKFSQFTTGSSLADIDYFVGYKGTDNIQVAKSLLSGTTYTVDVPAATTNINLAGSDSTNDAITLTGGQNITLSRKFNSDLITFQGDFEANENLSDSNILAKYDEQIDSKINDIINNYQGSDDSKQKLIRNLQGQASIYRANTQVKIRNKQVETVYDHINDGLSPILQDITGGNLDIEKGLQQAFNNINTYGEELGTSQKLDLYDALLLHFQHHTEYHF